MKEQILAVQRMQDYIVYCWDDNNPRIQLEPRGNRGYIKLKAVKQK